VTGLCKETVKMGKIAIMLMAQNSLDAFTFSKEVNAETETTVIKFMKKYLKSNQSNQHHNLLNH